MSEIRDPRDVRQGSLFRLLRHRIGWRQEDLGARSGLSQDMISLVERGRIGRMRVRDLRRIAHGLEADLVITLRWHGGDLDRLADEDHAGLVGTMSNSLTAAGWQTRIEVSYSEFGERGSIDLLAWHAGTRTLLVVEVKTELTSIEATVRKQDEKVRLAARVAGKAFGWQVEAVARLLVLPATATARRRVDRQDAVLSVTYPMRGWAVRRWLAAPSGAIAGLLFIDPRDGAGQATRVAPKRIRRRVPCFRE